MRFMRRDVDRSADNDEVAEHYFYGWFNFPPRARPREHVLVEYTTTQPFMVWSYEGLDWPKGLGREEFGTDNAFMEACAVNYLLKNFWHNFVHLKLQGISHSNYHRFGGSARFESDFEADNLANAFLVAAYGLPVQAGGRLSTEKNEKIELLLRRNRCNRMFALRAAARVTDAASRDQAEQWEEEEWRYRRSLANQISGWLIARGCTVASLGVYLTGAIRRGRDGFFREGEVVVAVNGWRIATNVPPYIPARSPRDFERKLADHHLRVAVAVHNECKAKLEGDPRFRKYCRTRLESIFGRAGLELA